MTADPVLAPSPSFGSTLAAVAEVEGWMTEDQARRLWERARACRSGQRIVEIGSFRGRSAIVLARAAAPGVDVVAIDPHAGNDRGPQELVGHEAEAEQDHDVFHQNLRDAGVDDRIRHLRRFSTDALGDIAGPVHLLYIDGAHRWRPAATDIALWGDRVPEDGVMLIHDSFSSIGVTLALMKEQFWSPRWRYVGRSQSMTEYVRVGALSVEERRANLVRQARQLPWFVRNVAIKALIASGLGRFTRFLGHPSGDWPY